MPTTHNPMMFPTAHILYPREESRGSEKDRRRRSSGFFLLLIAKGKQRRQREAVREKVWREWSSENIEGKRKQRRCVMWSSVLSSPWSFASHETKKYLNYIAVWSGNLNFKSAKRSGTGTRCQWMPWNTVKANMSDRYKLVMLFSAAKK